MVDRVHKSWGSRAKGLCSGCPGGSLSVENSPGIVDGNGLSSRKKGVKINGAHEEGSKRTQQAVKTKRGGRGGGGDILTGTPLDSELFTLMTGSGKSIFSRMMGLSFTHRVSPVVVSCSWPINKFSGRHRSALSTTHAIVVKVLLKYTVTASTHVSIYFAHTITNTGEHQHKADSV